MIPMAAGSSFMRWPAATKHLSVATSVSRSRASKSRSEEHTSELQSRVDLVCRLLLEKKKNYIYIFFIKDNSVYDSHAVLHQREHNRSLVITSTYAIPCTVPRTNVYPTVRPRQISHSY